MNVGEGIVFQLGEEGTAHLENSPINCSKLIHKLNELTSLQSNLVILLTYFGKQIKLLYEG